MPPKSSPSKTSSAVGTNPTQRAISPDHLSHPERWATGADPATAAQIGFIGVLEGQKHVEVGEDRKENMGKSEASEVIAGLKHGHVLPPSEVDAPGAPPPTALKRKHSSDEQQPSESNAADPETIDEGDKEVGKEDADQEDGEVTEDQDDGEVKETKAGKENSNGSAPIKKSSSAADSTSSSTSTTTNDAPPASKKPKTHLADSSKPESSSSKKMDTDDVPAAAKADVPKDPSAASTSNEDGKKEDRLSGSGGKEVPNAPGEAAAPSEDHLAHPEEWATGDEPATDKQLGYIAVLEKKSGEGVSKTHDGLGKSEASEIIEELKGE